MPGRIVLLNGASSSGKSTIAREFLALMPTPWFHMAVDDFHAMRAYRRYAEGEMAPVVRRTRAGFHRAVPLEVCTDRASPGECADAIKAFVESGLPPTAFDRLRAAT
ncbi:MAG TPA: hypothetical protein VFJ19_16845 [Nocardioidaceae bacterium]|nr:hypothetical protein [Nocardioidaceae bacterium]